MNCKSIFILFLFFLTSCSSDFASFKKKNLKVEVIQRSQKDIYYSKEAPKQNTTLLYPFEEENVKNLKITKDFFKCKGNPLNPKRADEKNIKNPILDCEGSSKHGLPLINSKEGVYPVLIDILNYIQNKTNKKVVITCGHRCPVHNAYSDILNDAQSSKHMIGAEVDFYVQGFEQSPQKIVDMIVEFYYVNARYKKKADFENFYKYQKPTDVTNQPIYNKEIFIKIYQNNEGRDFDNRHPYPYISIEVLWDRSTKEIVNFNLDKANKGYLHW
jgi:hypothetical protein